MYSSSNVKPDRGIEDAVARHLDRFAFREAPMRFDWQNS